MNEQKYKVFMKTVELNSITKAAEDLGYTQSGVSHIINSMEKELGTTLLIRDRSGVKVTTEGKELLPYIRDICNSNRALIDKVNSLHGLETGVIRIGTFSSVSCHLLPGLIKNFQKKYNDIDFELLQGDYNQIEDWVNEGRVDFGFLRLPSFLPLENIILKKDRLMVILPEDHKFADKSTFPVKELADESFILLEEGTYNEINDILQTNHIVPHIRFKVKDDYTIMSMVESGLGISILPELVLYRNPYHIVLKELDVHAYRRLGIVLRNKNQISMAAKYFINYIQTILKI